MYKNLTSQGYFISPPIPTYPMGIPQSGVESGTMLTVTVNQQWLRRVVDVISYMDQPDVWVGTEAEIEAARDESRKLSQILLEGSQAMSNTIGAIMPIATATTPENMLLCDGSQYLRIDYPDLYNSLNLALIVDSDHFVVPDLTDKFVLGTGARQPMATGGAETVALQTAQMPYHNHNMYLHSHSIAPHTHTSPAHNHALLIPNTPMQISPGSGSDPWGWVAPGGNVNMGTAQVTINETALEASNEQTFTYPTGNNSPHENMPPYVALAYAIVAK